MASFDDPFANVDAAAPPPDAAAPPPQPRPAKSGKKQFDQPLNVSKRDVYKATGTGGSAMHGAQYQLTTRLPLEVVEQLRDWAAQLNMTQQDLQRFCFYHGLRALDAGERPEFEEVVVTKKLKQP